jgi:lysophospholipase L1-like esterase
LVGLFLSALIAELFLRIYNPFGFRQKGDRIVLPADFELVYENDKIRGLDSVVVHTKNSLGFRGAEKPSDFEKWTSIIAVGGSTTECLYISDGKDWASLLGQQLNGEFGNIWINNAGLDGHSTFGHQILLNDYILDLKPGYLLFLIGCNDIGRDDLNNYDERNLKSDTNLKAFFINNSELVGLVVNLRRNFRARNMGLEHYGVDFGNLDFVSKVQEHKISEMVSSHGGFIKGYKSRVENLIKTAQRHGITPVLLTQPTLVGEGIDKHTGIDLERVRYCDPLGGKAYWTKLEAYNDVTRAVAETEGVLLIDLALKMPKSTNLFYDCVHYTNEGAKVVSDLLYEELRLVLRNK